MVTGATGFIGSHLARSLADRGDEVHAITRPGSHHSVLGDERVTLHEHDGTTRHLVQIVADVQPGAAFHLASLFLAQHGPDDVEPLVRSNLLFGAQLLEALSSARVLYLVNAGTSWQHSRDGQYAPACLYAATKQAFEQLVDFYVLRDGLRATTLKLFDTYGPRDPRRKLIAALRDAARTGEALALSPGQQLIDLLHVDDVVRGFGMALERTAGLPEPRHERWALRGERHSLREIVAIFSRVIPTPVSFGSRPYRPGEIMVPWEADCDLPGWQPTIDLESGLRRLLAADADGGRT
jgi:nucleoside-diphosphate-sugar epimerase